MEPGEVLLLFFLRRLLLFFPRAVEPSERTEELWMLALSKSDSSRSSSSLCRGVGAGEPRACPGGSSQGPHWPGQRMGRAPDAVFSAVHLISTWLETPKAPPTSLAGCPTTFPKPCPLALRHNSHFPSLSPRPCSPPCQTLTPPSRESPKDTSPKEPSQISP